MKGYTFTKYEGEHMAKALGISLPISHKQSVEICRFIKNKSIAEAKNMLQAVTERKVAVPFKRFIFDLGHKKKIGPGRYPENASREFIRIIEDVEANAQFKGLNTSNLIIAHISAHRAGKAWHYGRQTRRRMKRTNVEIIVEEKAKAETGQSRVKKEQNKSDSDRTSKGKTPKND